MSLRGYFVDIRACVPLSGTEKGIEKRRNNSFPVPLPHHPNNTIFLNRKKTFTVLVVVVVVVVVVFRSKLLLGIRTGARGPLSRKIVLPGVIPGAQKLLYRPVTLFNFVCIKTIAYIVGDADRGTALPRP